jgi:hypothetical protein
MTKTIESAFRNGSWRFNPPLAPAELDALVSGLSLSPSPALLKIWRHVGAGSFPGSWDFCVAAPSGPVSFQADDTYLEYEGASQLLGRSAFAVGQLWYGTDSHVRVLELADGDDAGALVGFSYGDNRAYKSDKTTGDLLSCVLELPVDTEFSEVSKRVFDAVFSAFPLRDLEKKEDA